jgi:hypothetical protein
MVAFEDGNEQRLRNEIERVESLLDENLRWLRTTTDPLTRKNCESKVVKHRARLKELRKKLGLETEDVRVVVIWIRER